VKKSDIRARNYFIRNIISNNHGAGVEMVGTSSTATRYTQVAVLRPSFDRDVGHFGEDR